MPHGGIELLTDILHELRDIKEEQWGTNVHLERTEGRVDKLEQQAKTNLALAELQTSVIVPTDRLELLVDHERRLAKVETVGFK